MIASSGYVLRVPKDRRAILLDRGRPYYFSSEASVAEPVPRFGHSSHAPLIVFCCFEKDAITHIADGRKGASAGTGLVRLNLTSLEPLPEPIKFRALLKRTPARLRAHLEEVLFGGGRIPPKTFAATIDAMLSVEPALSKRLSRFSEQRAALLRRLTKTGRENLAAQKETLTAALELAGLRTDEVLSWSPTEHAPRFFLEGMPEATLREDAMLVSDFSSVPGFDAIRQFPFATRVFESSRSVYLRVKLKVIMANRLALEEQTGADLIYYNETFRSFVMVQYKSMENGDKGPEFRWRPQDQLAEEITRMDVLLESLKTQPTDNTAASFRLHTNPFFLKLCPRLTFNPDDKGLTQGMYLPLDYWKSLATDSTTRGLRGGRLITYENVGRKLTNSEFVTIVANAWVGTTVPQSVVLEKVIESVIQTGKTVTLAVKSEAAPVAEDIDEERSFDLEEDFPE
jgi:hypothetical protein